MYARYMAAAFVANGLGAFGLRVLADAGLQDFPETQYLVLWYAAGLALSLALLLRRVEHLQPKEIVIGSGMALCSLGGQVGMALAITKGLPGFVVFPVATGGGLLLVVSVGAVVFKEQIGSFGWAGIGLGILALVFLALPA